MTNEITALRPVKYIIHGSHVDIFLFFFTSCRFAPFLFFKRLSCIILLLFDVLLLSFHSDYCLTLTAYPHPPLSHILW